MNTRDMTTGRLLLAALACVAALEVSPEANAQPLPDASTVLANLEKTFAGVEDFTATLEADIAMERVRIPRMQATMYFKRPDNVRYTSENFLMMPREGLSFNPAQLRERFDAVVESADTAGGTTGWRLRLTAKDAKARLRQLIAWVDAEHWTVVRIESVPYAGRKIQVRFAYTNVQGGIWLPSEASVQFSASEETDLQIPGGVDPQRAQPRAGTMTIRYTSYKINTGLSDELFRTPDQPH